MKNKTSPFDSYTEQFMSVLKKLNIQTEGRRIEDVFDEIVAKRSMLDDSGKLIF